MPLNPKQFGDTPVYTGSGLAANREWQHVSLSERRYTDKAIDASKEPGARWGHNVALVPVAQLAKYREFDRTATPKFADSESIIESIADDLRKGGVNALQSPISMGYDHKNKWGYVAEGNHRIAAAVRAGITHLPVQLWGNNSNLSDWKKEGVGAPLHLDNRMVEPDGYFPSDLHPGNFKEFEGAR